MKTHSINPRALGTASATNAITIRSLQSKPEVGMGATLMCYTDRHAYTIVATASVRGSKTIYAQRDRATRTDSNGQSESQDYSYAPNPEASVEPFTLRKDGTYIKRGEPMNGGSRLVIGEREEWEDPSF